MITTEVLDGVQYIIDAEGERTAVVVQLDVWKSLLSMLSISAWADLQEAEGAKTPEEIIANAQARPVDSQSVILPKGSLLDALQNPTYNDDDFILDEWTNQWSTVEREMKAITHQNDITEGRI